MNITLKTSLTELKKGRVEKKIGSWFDYLPIVGSIIMLSVLGYFIYTYGGSTVLNWTKEFFISIVQIPGDIYVSIKKLFFWVLNYLKDLGLMLIEQPSKFLSLIAVGVTKRFLIEDMILAPLLAYYVVGFIKYEKHLMHIRYAEFSVKYTFIKKILVAMFITPFVGVLGFLGLKTFAVFLFKKVAANKLLSAIKMWLLKAVPWLFTKMIPWLTTMLSPAIVSFFLDFTTFIEVFIQWIVTSKLVTALTRIELISKYIVPLFSGVVKLVKRIDFLIKKYLIAEWYTNWLKKRGELRKLKLLLKIQERGYNIDEIEAFLAKKKELKTELRNEVKLKWKSHYSNTINLFKKAIKKCNSFLPGGKK